jgi:NADH:ubiquinone oxidoreductase subunit 6 (subunit J)
MLPKIKHFILSLVLVSGIFTMAFSGSMPVAAAEDQPVSICTFIGPICRAIGIDDQATNASEAAGNFVRQRAQLVLSLVFVGIILLAVVIIIQNGIKYIQSQGNEGQIKDATKAIKSVFIGIGILFVGIAGIILVLAFFGGLGFLTQDPNRGECTLDPTTGVLTCPNVNEAK